MSGTTGRDDARSFTDPARVRSCSCDRCDFLVGLPGVHVIDVSEAGAGLLRVVVESPAAPMGCRSCGVVAAARGREVSLVDVPCSGRAVRVLWRKRTWRCPEPGCPVGSFSEVDGDLARPRALLTARAAWWALGQLRREYASIAGLARQLGTTWRTLWRAITPLLEATAAGPTRSNNVTTLGVDDSRALRSVRGPIPLAPRLDEARRRRRPRPERAHRDGGPHP